MVDNQKGSAGPLFETPLDRVLNALSFDEKGLLEYHFNQPLKVIQDGNQAERVYQRAVFGNVPIAEKEKILGHLREYCHQDTQAMLDILGALKTLA